MKMGTLDPVGSIRDMRVNPTMAKRRGRFNGYEEDGKTVWLIVTYKKGGSRAKPDNYPLGVCGVCGEGRRLAWKGTCPKCGNEHGCIV